MGRVLCGNVVGFRGYLLHLYAGLATNSIFFCFLLVKKLVFAFDENALMILKSQQNIIDLVTRPDLYHNARGG